MRGAAGAPARTPPRPSRRRSPRSSPRARQSRAPRPTQAKPKGADRGRTASGDARKVGSEVASIGVEVAKLAREMVVIPLQLWLAAAEVAGGVVLAALAAVRPARCSRALGARSPRPLRFAERRVTPARGVAAVGLVAIGALAASQWLDYRAISVGADAYSGAVGSVAPPPEVATDIAGARPRLGDAPAGAARPGRAGARVRVSRRRRRLALAARPSGSR